MPLAGPETALASTIDVGVEEIIVHAGTPRPGACKWPSTIFQSLTRRLNDLPRNRPASSGSMCARACAQQLSFIQDRNSQVEASL